MSRHHEIDEASVVALAQDLVRRIRSEEDPLELTQYRKLFKKAVPLFMRSYVAAYLFRQLYGRGGGVKKKINPVSIFISIGKNRRVFPRDLVQLLISAGKLAKGDIGDIKILDNYAFVEVDESQAAQVIRNLNEIMYRGRRLTVNYAKKKEEGTAPRREGRSRYENRRDTPAAEEALEEPRSDEEDLEEGPYDEDSYDQDAEYQDDEPLEDEPQDEAETEESPKN